ncbi:MAG: class I SAM-dependent methyltransferase [Phycisphaeraceae bacterium]|nr:class I SAM-dependent methyltransferase [Phycisphaerales bacterium]MCB9843121.1 class I SAM-dependent methyltransferase [Phycisphaeraceae bacterium]
MARTRRDFNKFDLYEWCVQSPAWQVRFLHALHGQKPVEFGDDFAGPASLARAWVAMGPGYQAVACDREAGPLEHARKRMAEHHDFGMDRLALRAEDVLGCKARADVIAAFNFAVCELHTRSELMTYLRNVVFRLRPKGVFVADLYGGERQFVPGVTGMEVETPIGTVLYEWEQRRADPTTARVVNAIHFELPDGTRMEDAFVYDWRLWGVAELREALVEAGFIVSEVYADYAEAMDGDGALMTRPIEGDEGEELNEDFVVYVAGRV